MGLYRQQDIAQHRR